MPIIYSSVYRDPLIRPSSSVGSNSPDRVFTEHVNRTATGEFDFFAEIPANSGLHFGPQAM
jgi:hypothetical protein